MKIAIISAMEKEVTELFEKIQNLEIVKYKNYEFKTGILGKHEVIVTNGGIGKTNTGIIVALMDSLFKGIDLIINLGISGGVKGKVNPGEVVISEKLSYSDFDATAFDYEFGQVPRLPKYYYGDKAILEKIKSFGKVGMILTGDKFVTDESSTNEIIEKHFKGENVLCFDMESTAFAQSAYVLGLPFVAVRAISDIIGVSDQVDNYTDYNLIACKKACALMEEILNK